MAKKEVGKIRDKPLYIDEPEDKRIIVEEPDPVKANDLAMSGEFCQPRYSDKRDCYILIRKKKA